MYVHTVKHKEHKYDYTHVLATSKFLILNLCNF